MLDEDELDERRRADELMTFGMGSPDAFIEQQANRNPDWMRRRPDMTIGTFEAEQAPDMTFGIDEAERAPDMEFSEIETDTAPNPAFEPDMEISLAEAEGLQPEQFARTQAPVSAGAYQSTAARPPVSMEAEQFGLEQARPRGLGEIDQRWADAENQALDDSSFQEEEYGIGEGLRDFIPLAAGLGLDIAFNKGRGVGNVAAGGMQAISSENTRRDRKKQQASENALAVRRQRQYESDDGLRRGDQALGWAGLAERRAANARLAQRQDYDLNPDNPAAAAAAGHVKALTGVDQSGLSTKQQGQVMPLAGRAQGLAYAPLEEEARTRAQLDTEHELAPRTAADAGDKAAEIEARARPERMITAGEEKDLKNPAIDSGGAPLLPQGIRDTTGKFTQLAQRNPDEAQRVVNTVTDMSKLENLTVQMVKVREAINQFPNTQHTKNNPEFSNLIGQWDELEGAYQAEYFKAQDRGAPQVYEDKRFQGKIGSPMTLEEAAKHPIEAVEAFFTNQKATLDGRLSALQQRKNAFVEAKFGRQDAAGGGGGTGTGGHERLPVTNQRRGQVPLVKDVVQGAPPDPRAGEGKPRAIQRPDGAYDIDGETYTEDEIQRLMRKGLVQ
jgi:hypothetical protein